MPIFAPQELAAAAEAIMRALGSDEGEAREVASHLVLANLSGHHSHGVGMLPDYVRLTQDGLAFPNRGPELLADRPALLAFDGCRGFGQRVARDALLRGAERAKQQGSCVVTLKNSSHIGRVGHYVEMLASRGLASVHFANVAGHEPVVAPFGSAQARLGTNPVAAGLPGGEGTDGPVVLDLATSTVAFGKARVAHAKGLALEGDALLDKDGRPTTDPGPMVERREGALRAFGLHKGSGFSVMAELFAVALAGGHSAEDYAQEDGGIVNSLTSFLVDLSQVADPPRAGRGAAAVGAWIHASEPAPGVAAVLLPGDPERAKREEQANGVEVEERTWSLIREAASSVGVSLRER